MVLGNLCGLLSPRDPHGAIKATFCRKNQVGGWIKRIIMNPIPLQSVQISLLPDEEVPTISISPIEPSETDMEVGYYSNRSCGHQNH